MENLLINKEAKHYERPECGDGLLKGPVLWKGGRPELTEIFTYSAQRQN